MAALNKGELWDLVVGGSAIATGGDCADPARAQFDVYVDPTWWRTERGPRNFHSWRWTFVCEYVPIDDAVGAEAARR